MDEMRWGRDERRPPVRRTQCIGRKISRSRFACRTKFIGQFKCEWEQTISDGMIVESLSMIGLANFVYIWRDGYCLPFCHPMKYSGSRNFYENSVAQRAAAGLRHRPTLVDEVDLFFSVSGTWAKAQGQAICYDSLDLHVSIASPSLIAEVHMLGGAPLPSRCRPP